MTDELKVRIAALRAGLEGVTPGPWKLSRYRGITVYADQWGRRYSTIVARCDSNAYEDEANSDHLARCDPGTIKDILDALEAAEARVKEFEEENASIRKGVRECDKDRWRSRWAMLAREQRDE